MASLLAVVFALKFILEDDLLYDYAEHLLSLRFYRQLKFIIVILPLVLIIPLFDAASVFFLSGYGKHELGSSLLGVRLCYQIVMGLMVFVGLAFIAPSTRYSGVRSQLEIEVFKHMRWRYQNDFSYQFLDRIQESYECCDVFWYRTNFHDQVPASCAVRDGSFNNYFKSTCDDVLASLISNRCLIIAFCLSAILLALGVLIGIDIVELLSASVERYDIVATEQQTAAKSGAEQEDRSSPTTLSHRAHNSSPYRSPEHDELIQEINNRLKATERERETPLLVESRGIRAPDVADIDDDWPLTDSPERGARTSPILTRASYLYNRPQSPVFVAKPAVTSFGRSPEPGTSSPVMTARPGTPTKSVLKKTSSFQKIDSSEEIDIEDDSSQMRRDTQTRRSLLNVRFAE